MKYQKFYLFVAIHHTLLICVADQFIIFLWNFEFHA